MHQGGILLPSSLPLRRHTGVESRINFGLGLGTPRFSFVWTGHLPSHAGSACLATVVPAAFLLRTSGPDN